MTALTTLASLATSAQTKLGSVQLGILDDISNQNSQLLVVVNGIAVTVAVIVFFVIASKGGWALGRIIVGAFVAAIIIFGANGGLIWLSGTLSQQIQGS